MIISLVVKHNIQLLEKMIDLFCDDAAISFEGDLSQADLRGIPVLSREPTAVLKCNTLQPKSDFLIIPLTDESKDLIKRQLLPRIGISTRVDHIQIEQHSVLVFGAYDHFDDDCVWVSLDNNQALLDSLVKQGILREYTINRNSDGTA
jgi:hypothetical protein